MPVTYLIVDFSQKAAVKALGARWDPVEKKWYVPEGRDLVPFDPWLPAALRPALTVGAAHPTALQVQRRGKSLSELLAGVADAVARAYRQGEWTVVDVVQATIKNHVYLEFAERDVNGVVLAKANAMIWANVADEILPPFEAATGMSVGPGIKLLVRARPVFSSQYGFRLFIDAVDPDFTLGELEARKREIRARLKQAGAWGANKTLAFPWDFNSVLVITPADAAGLGDFRAEAQRLDGAGVCRFFYAYSRFQGPGAAAEILGQTRAALADWQSREESPPDALVFIRGGGAVNDLAWLNDFELARFVCEVKIPVLTGIGHERDSTILDEVAHTSFDTPSKVIAGIEATIVKRTREVQAAFDEVVSTARGHLEDARRTIESSNATVRASAVRQLSHARVSTAQAMADVRVQAARSVGLAGERARDLVRTVRAQATTQLEVARQRTPDLLAQVRDQAHALVRAAMSQSRQALSAVLDRGRVDSARVRKEIDATLNRLADDARQRLATARTGTEALMREIAGQGPQKTLARGFAHVRDTQGKTVMSAVALTDGSVINVMFHDGSVTAHVGIKESKT